MKNIKRITLSITLFFMCSTAMVHAQTTDDETKVLNKMKVALN
ncbi:MAG: hypothetical protein CM1200mP16_02760 [Nitrospina sp.]|nr:MAG: hypothetical protein CM1200mP16_02760 [Nitrospina sp.]